MTVAMVVVTVALVVIKSALQRDRGLLEGFAPLFRSVSSDCADDDNDSLRKCVPPTP